MRKVLSSTPIFILLASSLAAHADTISTYTVTNGTLNTPSGTTGPGSATAANQVGTVSGSFVFDDTTRTFLSADLTYVVSSSTYTPGVTSGTYQVTVASGPYTGDTYSLTFLGSSDGFTVTTGDAGLAVGATGNLCTLDDPCAGTVASDLYLSSSITRIGAADVSIFSVSSSATPEPSSLALLGTGVIAAAGLKRRKLRKA